MPSAAAFEVAGTIGVDALGVAALLRFDVFKVKVFGGFVFILPFAVPLRNLMLLFFFFFFLNPVDDELIFLGMLFSTLEFYFLHVKLIYIAVSRACMALL